MVRRTPVRLALAVLALCGCGPRIGPDIDPVDYLRVGVDPEEELARLTENFAALGYEDSSRVSTEYFAGASFHDPNSGTDVVRVVTPNGIGLALDGPLDGRWTSLRLASFALADHFVVAADDDVYPRRCLALFHVTPEGVRELVLRVDPDVDECVEQFVDVGGDERPEALVVQMLPPLTEEGEVVRVEIPLAPSNEGWVLATDAVFSGFWSRQRAGHVRAIEVARDAGASDAVVRLAFELAWCALQRGAHSEETLQIFEEHAGPGEEHGAREARRRLSR